VLFSHPKDFTPVCTTELGNLAALKPEFERRNCKVLGLSVDPVDDHHRWLAQAALPWSATSALRLWRRTLAETGDPMQALARLDLAERATLARDRHSTLGQDENGPHRAGAVNRSPAGLPQTGILAKRR
jgi:peroxiredoxin